MSIAALIAGLLFGSGLLLSGMVNPANVLAFLDVTGHWQPALVFTMAAAVVAAAPAYWLAHRRRETFLHGTFDWPDRLRITPALVLGSAIFGVGWGLAGICPGPALLLLTRPRPGALIFFAGVVIGLLLAGRNSRRKTLRAPGTAS